MALPNAAYRWRGDWVNGDNYYDYDTVRSPLDGQAYVLDNGYQLAPSVLDPSVDPLWKQLTTTPTGFFSPSFAEFVSNTSQNLPANTQTVLTYDAKNLGTADIVPTGGVFPASSVTINTTGIYRAIFSVQIDKFGGGGADEFQFWFQLNGVNVPNTNSQTHTTQQVDLVMTIESFLSIASGQRLGVVGYTPVGAVQDRILAQPVDATHPVSIPSIILNIQRIA